MFEKESKAYAERTKTKKELEVLNKVRDWGIESLDPDERRLFSGIQDREKARKQGFREGAEFGYSKANEWHFVKNGEYPTHSNKVLVFTDEGVGFGIYGLDNKKWYTYDTGFDVIAWKEITLPALPKEIKEK